MTSTDHKHINGSGLSHLMTKVKAAFTPQSVLPADNGHVKTKFRITKVANTGGETWYYPLVQLPSDNTGNYASAIISGRIGGWVSENMSQFTALVWNRNTTGIALLDIAGSAGAMSSIWNRCDIVVYTDSGSTKDTVYLKCHSYFTFDIDVELFQSTAEFKWTGEYQTTTPGGTLGAQASTSTRRVEIVNGKLLVNGVDLSVVSNLSGTLGVAHGGTGQTSAINAANALLNALSTGSSDPTDADYYISQYVGGGTSTTTYHRRPMSALWNYVKGKFKSTMLSSATNSSSEELAATPKAVKAAYDLANTANTTAGQAMSAATGALAFKVTYSVEDGAVTCYAHVYSAGSEVTENYEDECFDWSMTLDGGTSWVVLGTGKEMPLTAMTAFGGNVKCDFTPPES